MLGVLWRRGWEDILGLQLAEDVEDRVNCEEVWAAMCELGSCDAIVEGLMWVRRWGYYVHSGWCPQRDCNGIDNSIDSISIHMKPGSNVVCLYVLMDVQSTLERRTETPVQCHH